MNIKYIRTVDEYVPIILQGNKLVELNEREKGYTSLYNKENQFNFSLITTLGKFYYHGSNGRLYKYNFGKGMLQLQGTGTSHCAIFCEDRKVVVENNWAQNYTPDFARFKKMLKENGYNTKKDIIYMDSLENFFFDPVAPTFQDYQESVQKDFSKEFILSQREAIINVEFNPLIMAC